MDTKPHITPDLVDKVANLARLTLTEEERQNTLAYFEEVLTYIDRIASVPVDSVEPYGPASQRLEQIRSDVSVYDAQRKELVSGPTFSNGLMVTKGIFDRSNDDTDGA